MRSSWPRSLLTPAFAIFVLSRLLLAAYDAPQSDVFGIYYEPVARPFWVDGAWPYVATGFPYPPVALVPVLLPGLWSVDFSGYHAAFQAQMLVVDIATCVLLVRLLARQLEADAARVRVAIWTYTVLGFGLAVVIYDRLDIVVALFCMIAANLYRREPPGRLSYYASIALGGLFKIAPIFWLPLAAFRDVTAATRGRWRWIVAGVLPAAIGIAATSVIGLEHAGTSINDHALRPIEIESVWATPLVVARWLGAMPGITLRASFGSTNIDGAPEAFVALSRYAGFALLAVFYLAWIRRARRSPDAYTPLAHAEFIVAVLLILMATQRVLSPQYFLWLLPGLAMHVAMAAGRERLALAAASIAMCGLTFALFPLGFGSLRAFETAGVIALVVRNGLLVGLAGWAGVKAISRRAH